MRECDCIRWKVYDADENLMRHSNPPTSTQCAQAIETLKQFLNGLAGGGYVLIVVFIRKATEEDNNGRTRMRKGGDTANSSFSFFYKIGESDARPVNSVNAPAVQAGFNDLLQRNIELQMQLKDQQHAHEIKELKELVKELKSDSGKGWFNDAVESLAKELYTHYKRDKAQPVAGVETTQQQQQQQQQAQKQNEEMPTDAREAVKRCAQSAVKVMKVAERFGGSHSDVVEGFEDFAKLAETNPAKLMEIMQQIKAAASE